MPPSESVIRYGPATEHPPAWARNLPQNALERGPKAPLPAFEIRRCPTLPGPLDPSTIGAGGLNCRVQNGNGCDPAAIATENQVRPPPQRSAAGTIHVVKKSPRASQALHSEHEHRPSKVDVYPSPRPISTGRLNTLPCLHLRPINVVFCHGPYPVSRWEISS